MRVWRQIVAIAVAGSIAIVAPPPASAADGVTTEVSDPVGDVDIQKWRPDDPDPSDTTVGDVIGMTVEALSTSVRFSLAAVSTVPPQDWGADTGYQPYMPPNSVTWALDSNGYDPIEYQIRYVVPSVGDDPRAVLVSQKSSYGEPPVCVGTAGYDPPAPAGNGRGYSAEFDRTCWPVELDWFKVSGRLAWGTYFPPLTSGVESSDWTQQSAFIAASPNPTTAPPPPDFIPPTNPRVLSPATPFTLNDRVLVRWSGATDENSGVDWVRISVRRTGLNGVTSFPSRARTGTAGSTRVALRPGATVCVRMTAVDFAGNRAAPSPRSCQARPVDDRALAARGPWTRLDREGAYLASVSRTTTRHATLRLTATGKRYALVATKCPRCGKVAVYAGSTRIAVVDLRSSRLRLRTVTNLPVLALRTRTITVKVLTSGKRIDIDGLGVSRA